VGHLYLTEAVQGVASRPDPAGLRPSGSREGGRVRAGRRLLRIAPWGAFVMLVALVGAACGASPVPTAAPPSLSAAVAAEVDGSIPIREANGLRADRTWVIAVVLDPASVLRFGIRVSLAEAFGIDEREIAAAITFRANAGMRADEAWVRQVEADPGAQTRYGVRMTSEEAAAMDRRIRTALDAPLVVVPYADQHPEDWGGYYLDRSGGGIVALVTRDVEEHQHALQALFAPGTVTVEVKEVRWSLRELYEFDKAIWSAEGQAWLKKIGVGGKGGGPRIDQNDVWLEVKIPAPDPGLAARIIDHFQGGEWLSVDVRVVPALALPFGSLEIKVVDRAGRPVAGMDCKLIPTVVGAGGDSLSRDSDPSGICSWEDTHATLYGVEIWREVEGKLLGKGQVTVPARGLGRVTIVVDPR
jgi:hypothetical protein